MHVLRLFSKYLRHFKSIKDKMKLVNKGAIMIFLSFLKGNGSSPSSELLFHFLFFSLIQRVILNSGMAKQIVTLTFVILIFSSNYYKFEN